MNRLSSLIANAFENKPESRSGNVFGRLEVIAVLIFSSTYFSACLTPEEQKALSDTFELNPIAGSLQSSTATSSHQSCYLEQYQQPDAEISRSIDILFVMDTSGSMDDNRAKVAEGISSFVAELPNEVDYRVAVMLAHGSQTPWTGKLFTYNGATVFNSKINTISEIETRLRAMVLHTPLDTWGEQGEEGSYSLIKGLTTNLDLNRQAGFFRTDAALSIVFVSDENDICAPYIGKPTKPGLTSIENSIRSRDCSLGISTDEVVSKVKSIQGARPYLFGSVTHVDPNYDDLGGNDGYGWGYMEVIQATHGLSIEINNGSYTQGLSDLGKLATKKLHLILDHPLERANIDPTTISVSVDGVDTEFTYDSLQNEIHLAQGGRALSEVKINYCLNPTPCPSPTNTGNPGPQPSPSANPSPTPSVSPSPSPSASPSASPSSSPSTSPSPSPSSSPSASPSPTPTCTGLSCGVLGI